MLHEMDFRNRLPDARLGKSHENLESFLNAVAKHDYRPEGTKEFTLVVVTALPRSILLGLKHRGFGEGMFNSFGGKFDHEKNETPEDCACRELLEETNIRLAPSSMRKSKVGILRYTFEEDPVEMIMHLYHIHMPEKECQAYSKIRACEEITPKWFDNWQDMPLDNMFADDSIWLPMLLGSLGDWPLKLDGRFHFRKNCQATNTILHYFIDTTVKTDDAHFREIAGKEFQHRLPASRLGTSHESMESFNRAIMNHCYNPTRRKEYTLVVVTAGPRHILLGLKKRGFAEGMYNSFGGKIEPDETPDHGASRELLEETNIDIPQVTMRKSKVGVMHFTSEEDPVEMVVHLFRIHMPRKDCQAYADIRECDEMKPRFYDDWREVPLNNMFADDSVWLPVLLSSTDRPIEFDGWFHFRRDLLETNSILHYYMDIREKPRYTLEQRLFHAIHCNQVKSPNVKEFKECYSFQNIVRSACSSKKYGKPEWDIVIDVAGGHGALAALFLVVTNAKKAVVVDPASVGGGGVERAWKEEFFPKKELVYRFECLRTGLAAELKDALAKTSPERILVVACHACQHLSEETLEIACSYGVHAAIMPCCQKDLSEGSSWKHTSKNLSIPIGQTMDLLLAGKMMAFEGYDVRMKLMDPKITPQNRIIICQRIETTGSAVGKRKVIDAAHARLTTAYRKAHEKSKISDSTKRFFEAMDSPIAYLGLGFLVGVSFSSFCRRTK